MTFQSASSEQGREFENQCVRILEDYGFTIRARKVRIEDVEIDIVANTATRTCWFECKGSYRDGRPGLLRTDTMKKAIANGWLTKQNPNRPPYIILTSNMPENSGLRWLSRALTDGIFSDVVCVYDIHDKKRLRDWANDKPTQRPLMGWPEQPLRL